MSRQLGCTKFFPKTVQHCQNFYGHYFMSHFLKNNLSAHSDSVSISSTQQNTDFSVQLRPAQFREGLVYQKLSSKQEYEDCFLRPHIVPAYIMKHNILEEFSIIMQISNRILYSQHLNNINTLRKVDVVASNRISHVILRQYSGKIYKADNRVRDSPCKGASPPIRPLHPHSSSIPLCWDIKPSSPHIHFI